MLSAERVERERVERERVERERVERERVVLYVFYNNYDFCPVSCCRSVLSGSGERVERRAC